MQYSRNTVRSTLLSIVVPFFNSVGKCDRLLRTLSRLDAEDVELILVDDGSTDGTLGVLEEFTAGARIRTSVVSHENAGPGGAKNTGLDIASGEYIWFVDSDDDVSPPAIDVLRSRASESYDFIDFNNRLLQAVDNHMQLPEGPYSSKADSSKADVRRILLGRFGLLVTKIFRRAFLVEHGLRFLTYSYYEDTPLLGFVLPFHVKRFYKSEAVGYEVHIEHQSITRSPVGPRFFDQQYTAIYGIEYGIAQALDDAERKLLGAKFARFFLVTALRKLVSRWPSVGWIQACRIMRQYRQVGPKVHAPACPVATLDDSVKFRLVVMGLWLCSYFVPEQDRFFARMRRAGWPRWVGEP